MIKTFKSTDRTQLTTHFNVSEFKCKCGGSHDTKLDTDLADKLEKLLQVQNILITNIQVQHYVLISQATTVTS